MDLKDLDLNLLLVFDRLHTERRVARVAEQLGLSQPAVSNALARLRRLLDDDLFVRTPRGMAPTPLAQALAPAVGEALSGLQQALSARADFDPATSTRRFSLGMSDIGEIYFLPGLLPVLARQAPGLGLSTVRNTAVQLREEMEAGQVDLAIGLLPQLATGFFQQRLFEQRYVCLARQDHPLLATPLTPAAYGGAEHVRIVAAGTGHGQVEDLLQCAGIERRVRLSVPHHVALGHILQATDLIATVPERLAQRMTGPFGLRAVDAPVPLPNATIRLYWHARAHRDGGNRWLRALLFELFADPPA